MTKKKEQEGNGYEPYVMTPEEVFADLDRKGIKYEICDTPIPIMGKEPTVACHQYKFACVFIPEHCRHPRSGLANHVFKAPDGKEFSFDEMSVPVQIASKSPIAICAMEKRNLLDQHTEGISRIMLWHANTLIGRIPLRYRGESYQKVKERIAFFAQEHFQRACWQLGSTGQCHIMNPKSNFHQKPALERF